MDLENALVPRMFCEAIHTDELPCSIDVAARKTTQCSPRSFNICETAYRWNLTQLATSLPCSCGRKVRDCWNLIPI